MKSIWIAILLAVSASTVFSQYEITGRVINDEGQALIGANVYVDLTFRGAITDINGKFIISNLPGGSYVVKASYIGYTTSSDTINMQGNMNLSFVLNS
ncbi:unnamed protein product, partial [marine sediment metagenome]